MSLVKCKECGQEISDKAVICVKCGAPQAAPGEIPGKAPRMWDAVTRARTPINIFALAMMACAAVLGYSATKVSGCESLTAFTYTIHVFLAVSGMFFLAILFCRKGIYHPEDLSRANPEVIKQLGKDQPGLAVLLIVAMLLAYGLYQYFKKDPCAGVYLQHSGQVQLTPKGGASD